MSTTPIVRASASLQANPALVVEAFVSQALDGVPIATVDIGSLVVSSRDVDALLSTADAFQEAARRLRALQIALPLEPLAATG